MKKTENTCRWRVDFENLAYDGGGSSWTQYYWTKIGALFSLYSNLYVRSWGGRALLIDLEKGYTDEEIAMLMRLTAKEH